MGKQKLRGKDLLRIGYVDHELISQAIHLTSKHYKFLSKEEKLNLLEEVFKTPKKYVEHEILSAIAEKMLEEGVEKEKVKSEIQLREEGVAMNVFGKPIIDSEAIEQMEVALRLPISVQGAMMPDAHVGYGLPIGGVLATNNAVIPYGVGLDIGCRMCLSLFPYQKDFFNRYSSQIKRALKEHTYFGVGTPKRSEIIEHEVLDDQRFKEDDLLRKLQHGASLQIGTSGSGNHFVEFGEVELSADNNLGVEGTKFIGLLSHSGSRGLGASIANYYTKLAKEQCLLPKGAKHLAWLDLNSEEGIRYWISMNLAGDYAKACHDVIHKTLSKELGLKTILKIENHHNFAWKELIGNEEVIVHRKGATPASKGELGIIPASMTAPGYIVSGKGNESSINSAAHGAGRKLSRKKAKESVSMGAMKKVLKEKKVELIGGQVDEAPMAYKDLEKVMPFQSKLIHVEGSFTPKVVRMNK